MNPIGLYIHVPFCEHKCPYCDFYSIKYSNELINKYTDTICNLLVKYSKTLDVSFDTLYFGGGTPSLLGTNNLCKIIKTIKENFIFLAEEVTLEMNPTTINGFDLEKVRSLGVNRLSIGVQSAVNSELKLLGRHHNLNEVKKTINLAKKSGFNNISLDLMISIPNQTKKSLQESIDFCTSQNIQHISAYMLKLEKGTPFFKNQEKLNIKSEDEYADLYLFAVSQLERKGFFQYEISNFCKTGFEGKHNLKYWQAKEYLGLGPSAHSFINRTRFFYPRSLNDFIMGKSCTVDDGTGGTIEEYIMLCLRLKKGLIYDEFKEYFGFDFPNVYLKKAMLYENYGLLNVTDKSISFTPKGFLVSNELTSRILF